MLRPGQRFGRLVVVCQLSHGSNARYRFLCDCGSVHEAVGSPVSNGIIQSCGCLHREICTTHGGSKTPEYKIWHGMLTRCRKSGTPGAKNYVDRGIRVCERWHDFGAFIEDMGPRPSEKHSIERVDNSLGYSPENCRWATKEEQVRNTRANIRIEFGGVSMIAADWAKRLGMTTDAVARRLHRGWSIERAVTVPARRKQCSR